MPAGIIWPTSGAPKFVKGHGPRSSWCEFDVKWTLPAGVKTIVAAQEQFFAYPYNDRYVIDDAVPAEPRTWHKTPRKAWYKYCTYGHTLMLRVIMGDDAAVAPTSLGRVRPRDVCRGLPRRKCFTYDDRSRIVEREEG
jgi:hypothetical protein